MIRYFDSGVLLYYDYGRLDSISKKKRTAGTINQDRMLKSAVNFVAGFFGPEWTKNVTLEVILEANGFNDRLTGYGNCNNLQGSAVSRGGTNASVIWQKSYLQNAVSTILTTV